MNSLSRTAVEHIRKLLFSVLLGGESVATRYSASFKPAAKPLRPLRRTSVGEALPTDVPGSHTLQTVVTDRRRGAHPIRDIRLVDEFTLFGGVAPHPGEAIRLEFQLH